MQGSRPESGTMNALEIQQEQKRKYNENWKVRGDYYSPMEEDFFFRQDNFMWNGFTESVLLLSEDTQVETQSNNKELEPILTLMLKLDEKQKYLIKKRKKGLQSKCAPMLSML